MEQHIETFENKAHFFQQFDKLAHLKKKVIDGIKPQEFYRQLLTFLHDISHSEIGLIGFVKKEGQDKVLRLYDLVDFSKNNNKQEQFDEQIKKGAIIKEFESLVNSKLDLDQVRLILPIDKHINNYLTLPLIVKNNITTVILIANRQSGYDKKLAEQLSFFCDSINLMIELKRHHSLIHDIVKQDRLTLLHSQTFFEHSMPSVIAYHQRENKSFCLLLIEISNLKAINQELGHSLGDRLLYQFTQRLDLNIKHRDIMVRVSGSKFVIILNDIPDFLTAGNVAKRIYNIIVSPFYIDDHTINCKYSIGVSCYPEAGQSYEELMKNAEVALYKAQNKDGFQFYSEELDNEFIEANEIEKELITALEKEELYVEYQPQVHIFTQMITGFEGLLPWKHPIRGNIPPSIFIPIAIKNGLAEAINLYVLNRTIKDFKSILENREYPLKISINVSPHVENFENHNQELTALIKNSGNILKAI